MIENIISGFGDGFGTKLNEEEFREIIKINLAKEEMIETKLTKQDCRDLRNMLTRIKMKNTTDNGIIYDCSDMDLEIANKLLEKETFATKYDFLDDFWNIKLKRKVSKLKKKDLEELVLYIWDVISDPYNYGIEDNDFYTHVVKRIEKIAGYEE